MNTAIVLSCNQWSKCKVTIYVLCLLCGSLEFGVPSDTVRGMSRPSDVARSV